MLMIWHHQVSLRKASSTQVSSLTLKKKKKIGKLPARCLFLYQRGFPWGRGREGDFSSLPRAVATSKACLSAQPGHGGSTRTQRSQRLAPRTGPAGDASYASIVFLDTAKLMWFPSQPFMPPGTGGHGAD